MVLAPKCLLICINQASAEKQNQQEIYMERERERVIDFKKLAHCVVGAGQSEICRASLQAKNSGRS